MNKIMFISRFVTTGRIGRKFVANTQYIRPCLPQQSFRFLSTEEDKIEDNKIEEIIIEDMTMKDITERKRSPTTNVLRDRRGINISAEASIEYLNSDAYKQTYGSHKVWHLYRRNFAGQWSPFRARNTCIVNGRVWSVNPCPICRDEYLVLHYTNLDLVKQFISPHTGIVFPNTLLCLCTEQYDKLLVAVNLAKNYGLLTFQIPLRQYDYKEYFKDYNPKLFECQHNH